MKNRKLIFKETDWIQLREHLIRKDNLEWAAFAFITKDDEDPESFFVRRIALIQPDAYAAQTPVFNSLKDEALVELMNEIKKSDEPGLMEIHSHPFASKGIFSSVDDANYPGFRKDILKRKPDGFMMRMVIGQDENGYTCLYTNPLSGNEESLFDIAVIGRRSFRKIKRFTRDQIPGKELFSEISKKFFRNRQVFGKSGTDAISNITLGCIAAGGAMNPFILEAAHAGFRQFRIVDYDLVEEINFNRLLGLRASDIGEFKVDILLRELKNFDPAIEVIVSKKRFQENEAQQILKDADILVSGVDNDEARLAIQFFGARFMKPLFDMGSGIYLNDQHTQVEQKGSQVRVYIPGNACLICQGLDVDKIHSETYLSNKRGAGYIINTNETPGSVITLNTSIASMTLSLMVDYVTGNNRIPLHLSYDELNYKIKTHDFESRNDCYICGKNGITGQGVVGGLPDGGLDELPDATEMNSPISIAEEIFKDNNEK